MTVQWQKAMVAFLILAIFLCAFAVVNIKHKNRSAFIELQALIVERNELRVEWERLQLGLNAFGNPGRVEEIAYEQLDMHIPSKNEIVNIVIYE